MAKILILGDMAYKGEGFCTSAMAAGHRILLANDGPQGLDLLTHHRPHCVVLDTTIPRMEYARVLERLNGDRARIPVVVVAAQTQKHARQKCTSLGVERFVGRPLRNADCHGSVEHVLACASRWDGSYSVSENCPSHRIELAAPPHEVGEDEMCAIETEASFDIATSVVGTQAHNGHHIQLMDWPERTLESNTMNHNRTTLRAGNPIVPALQRACIRLLEWIPAVPPLPHFARQFALLFAST